MISHEGTSTVILQCQQDQQYSYMYWYRQASSREMQRLAFSFGKDSSSTEAPFTTAKFIMSRPALPTSSLQIKSLQVADSAVYYCASSVAQWFRKPQQFNNNLRSNPTVVLANDPLTSFTTLQRFSSMWLLCAEVFFFKSNDIKAYQI